MSRAPVMAAVVAETSLRAAPMTTSVPDKSPSARTDLAAAAAVEQPKLELLVARSQGPKHGQRNSVSRVEVRHCRQGGRDDRLHRLCKPARAVDPLGDASFGRREARVRLIGENGEVHVHGSECWQ